MTADCDKATHRQPGKDTNGSLFALFLDYGFFTLYIQPALLEYVFPFQYRFL
jgi:hypothetical protein